MNNDTTQMPSFRKTLLIGLGGSGHKVAVTFKRRMIDLYGTVPPAVQILGIDTTTTIEKSERKLGAGTITLDNDEFLPIKVDDPMRALRDAPAIQDWWIEDVPAIAITNGAGAVRILGRLAWHFNVKEIRRRIDAKRNLLELTDLPDRMRKMNFAIREGELAVYLVGSIAGGSGAGMFLDLAYLCRTIFPGNIMVTAFLITSEMFKNLPFTQRTEANCYASLLELEYYMAADPKGGRRRIPGTDSIQMGSDRIETKSPPLNVVHLLDGRRNLGNRLSEPRHLYAHIAECLAVSIAAVGGEIADIETNLRGALGSIGESTWHGRPARFSSVGVASLVYPVRFYTRVEQMERIRKLASEGAQQLLGAKQEVLGADNSTRDNLRTFLQEEGLDLNNPVTFVDRILKPSPQTYAIALPPAFDLVSAEASENVKRYVAKKVETLQQQFRKDVNESAVAASNRWIEAIQARLSAEKQAEERGARPRGSCGRLATALLEITDGLSNSISRMRDDARLVFQEASNHVQSQEEQMKTVLKQTRWVGARRLAIQKQEEASAYTKLHEIIVKHYSLNLLYEHAVGVCKRTRELLEMEISEARKSIRHDTSLGETWIEVQKMAEQEKDRLLDGGLKDYLEPFEVLVGGENKIYYYLHRPIPETGYDAFLNDKAKGGLPNETNSLFELAEKWVEDRIQEALSEISVLDVLEKGEKDSAGYILRMVDALMRNGFPLWRYQQGLLDQNPEGKDLCQIISAVGTHSPDRATAVLRDILQHAPQRMVYPPCFSPTQDRSRLFLVTYEAALPLYLLDGVENLKRSYDNTVSPSPHIDKRFQYGLEDLMPEDAVENQAFEILALGIAPELDCVHEEKDMTQLPGQRRRYVVRDPAVCGRETETILGDRFWTAHEYLVDNDGVREAVQRLLQTRRMALEAQGPNVMGDVVLSQLKRLAKRFLEKDFRRPLAGRCLYREMRYLLHLIGDSRSVEAFLESQKRR